jgi:hypothetical protein
MTQKNLGKTRARELQARTGWSYQRCLNLVRVKTEAEIDGLVRFDRGIPKPREVPDENPGNDCDPPPRDYGDL